MRRTNGILRSPETQEDWSHAGQDWKAAEIPIGAIQTLSDADAQRVIDAVDQAIKEKKSAQQIVGTITAILGTAVGVLK